MFGFGTCRLVRLSALVKPRSRRRAQPLLPFRENLRSPRIADGELATQLNLGPKSAAWLVGAGIRSRDDVARLGVIETCRRVRARGHPVSVLLAYALEGALAGCHWQAIPWETKCFLRAEFAKLRRAETTDRRAAARS